MYIRIAAGFQKKRSYSPTDLFRTPEIRKMTVNLCFTWYVVAVLIMVEKCEICVHNIVSVVQRYLTNVTPMMAHLM